MLDSLSKDEFNSIPTKTILTTLDWIEFVIEDSNAKPYILMIYKNNVFLGYFSALIFRKLGLKIIASPFPGWSTPHMGFDFYDNSQKSSVIPELVDYIMKTEKVALFQMTDRDISLEEANVLKLKYDYIIESGDTLEIDVDADDQQLYKNMKTDCRNFIKQFERRGAKIEFAEPDDNFAEEYYKQLLNVFAKQKKVPTYSVDKVKRLLRHLAKNNLVLCLRVRDPEGVSIATSIFPGFNKKFFFWGGASLQSYQHYRPNEYMIYTAMKYWRDRGCKEFDMVGIRPYKKKFGSWEVHYPIIIVPRFKILYYLKNIIGALYYFMGSVKWRLQKLIIKKKIKY